MAEPRAMNKPSKKQARPLADFIKPCLGETFSRQGFASAELVTRWADIVGPDIAAHCEPVRMQWGRPAKDQPPDPATLVVRVEGPTAVEIQHLSPSYWSGSIASLAGRLSDALPCAKRRSRAASDTNPGASMQRRYRARRALCPMSRMTPCAKPSHASVSL